jgi:hypothetical protein
MNSLFALLYPPARISTNILVYQVHTPQTSTNPIKTELNYIYQY